MLDGVWQVYTEDGTYLGRFSTRIGNAILMVDAETAEKIRIGSILHIDETHSQKAWEVRVTGNYRGRSTQFTFEKLFDRIERYEDRKVEIEVTSYNFFEEKSNMWSRLIEYVVGLENHPQAVRIMILVLLGMFAILLFILKYIC